MPEDRIRTCVTLRVPDSLLYIAVSDLVNHIFRIPVGLATSLLWQSNRHFILVVLIKTQFRIKIAVSA